MTKTVHQVSAGGLVYRKQGENIEVAVATRDNGRVHCLPKGHVEQGETLEQAALREVREETGLKAEIINKINSINYWFFSAKDKVRIFKTVHFFLMSHKGGDIQERDFELEEIHWMKLPEAEKLLTYKSEKDILAEAGRMLKPG